MAKINFGDYPVYQGVAISSLIFGRPLILRQSRSNSLHQSQGILDMENERDGVKGW